MGKILKTEPQKWSINDFISYIEEGKFFLPSFQRDFEWTIDKIKELIESILKGYPIGVIVLWKPQENPEKIDSFCIPFTNNSKKISDYYFIIDGQQRLTSLYLLFKNWKIKRGDGKEIKLPVPLSYVVDTGKIYKSAKYGIEISLIMKACVQTPRDFNALEELRQKLLTPNLQEIERKFSNMLNFGIPVYIIETSNEDDEIFNQMAEIFTRINRLGLRIGTVEFMLSYIAGKLGGEIKTQTKKIYEDLNRKFSISLQPVIRSIFSNFELKQSDITNIKRLDSNVKRIESVKNRKKIIENSKKALEVTISLLKEYIPSASLLPSQNSIIPIVSFFYNPKLNNIYRNLKNLNKPEKEKILNWLILVNMRGYYTSGTDIKLEEDIRIIRNNKNKEKFPLKELMENMKKRRVKEKLDEDDIKIGRSKDVTRKDGFPYQFLIYLLLVKKEATDWAGVLIKSRKKEELQLHHIFPRDYLISQNIVDEGSDEAEININNLGNITYINSVKNAEISDSPPVEYLARLKKEDLRKHFIPTDRSIWKGEKYDEFLDKRLKLIWNDFTKFFPEITVRKKYKR